MIKNQSQPVDIIKGVDFVDLKPSDISPLVSLCEIKVLYLGTNRNGSYIDKDTALKMATTLRGTPIVGAYRKDIEDFGDHGHVVTIEDGEVKFSCKTLPYGFVAPDAEVWFKNFIDTDEFNNQIERTYLMTQGYLWTGQYPEVQKALDEGLPQSMELDDKTISGHWSIDNNSGVEFFIINDAIFSKLCILGSNVEPCFEGAAVTDVNISKYFTKDTAEFTKSLYTMIQLLSNKGGSDMPEDYCETAVEACESAETEFVAEQESEYACGGEKKKEYAEKEEEEKSAEESAPEEEEDEKKKPATDKEYAAEEKKEEFAKQPAKEEEADTEEEDEEPEEAEEDEKEKAAKKYALLEEKCAALEAELVSLREFKQNIDNQQKEALCAKYVMLSDEDKAEIMQHKEEYTLDEIEAKLALLYVKKNVDFSTPTGVKEEEPAQIVPTFSLDAAVDYSTVPEIVKALRAAK